MEPIQEHEQEQLQAEREARLGEEANFDETEIEPSEENAAINGLSFEAYADYRAIRQAVQWSKLPQRLIDLAVKTGLKART